MAGRRIALLIGTDQYRDIGLSRLAAPAFDMRQLAVVLGDPAVAGFAVTELYNRPVGDVGRAIGSCYRNARRDDLVLVYFTGHGVKDDDGQLHLAMTDTFLEELQFSGLHADQLRLAMDRSVSRQKVLILDCCYAGAFPRDTMMTRPKGDTAVHALAQLGGRGSVVLTSSDATQYSFEDGRLTGSGLPPSSLFTRFLVEGLTTGRADLDGDGVITLDELYSYVHDHVTRERPQQRPKKKDDVEGRIVFALNAHWELPAHVSSALASPYPAAKLAALDELSARYESGSALVQERVVQAIRQLTDDDSRQVSATANQLLSAVAKSPSQYEPVPEPVRQHDRKDALSDLGNSPAPPGMLVSPNVPVAGLPAATTTGRGLHVASANWRQTARSVVRAPAHYSDAASTRPDFSRRLMVLISCGKSFVASFRARRSARRAAPVSLIVVSAASSLIAGGVLATGLTQTVQGKNTGGLGVAIVTLIFVTGWLAVSIFLAYRAIRKYMYRRE